MAEIAASDSLGKRKRLDTSDEESSCEYDARDHFMLMPERKRQLQAEAASREKKRRRKAGWKKEGWKNVDWKTEGCKKAERVLASRPSPVQEFLATVRLVRRLPESGLHAKTMSTLQQLNDDCMIQVMQQMKIFPDLWTLISTYPGCRDLWENNRRSILIGMQANQHGDYLELFGKIGDQSDMQIHNLWCAVATDRRYFAGPYGTRYDHTLDLYTEHATIDRANELEFVLFLQCLDNFFDRLVERLHADKHSFVCCRTTRHAVRTLWEMGWVKPQIGSRWPSENDMVGYFDVQTLRTLLKDQPTEVRLRIRDITHMLSRNAAQFGLTRMSDFADDWINREELL